MTDSVNILEINDCSVRLTDHDQVFRKSGFALYEDNWVATGEDAQSRYRLRPLNGNDTFWQQLNLDPLNNASGLIKHSADLVYHHLSELLRASNNNAETALQPVIIAYPGFYRDEQLSLLLGICQSLNLPVAGLINSALLHASGQDNGHCTVVEQYLHQTLISEVSISEDRVQITDSQLLSNTGWVALCDALVRAISDEFIRQTRFNPRHDAEHEQALYNQLPQWLAQIQSGESTVQVAEQSITLGFNLLADAGQQVLQPVFDALAQQQETTHDKILLSPQAAWIRNWHKNLSATAIAADHLAQQGLRFRAQLTDASEQDGTLITEQLILNPDNQQPVQDSVELATSQRNIVATPTHILSGAHAHPIAGELWLSATDNAVSDQPTACDLGKITAFDDGTIGFAPSENCLLNQQPLSTTTLLDAQDTLANDQVSYQLIQVVTHG